MSFLDKLTGQEKIQELNRNLRMVKEEVSKLKFETTKLSQENLSLIDNSHSFFERLKQLVGTLEGDNILEQAWGLVNSFLSLKKGAILEKRENSWEIIFSEGFAPEKKVSVPFDEESMIIFAASNNCTMTLNYLKQQDDLGYLQRRGAIPDCKIVCTVKVRGEISKLIVVCNYGGNIFESENEVSLLETVSKVIGLVLTNAEILEEQKKKLDKSSSELLKIRNIFSKMVAPEIIQHIENNPAGIILGGERKVIAIFFADIRGFTKLSEASEPELIIELLNNFFTMLTEIIIEEKGTLDKFMGDAAMVLFGAPIPLPNASLNALNAAIRIQKRLEDLRPEWKSKGIPNFEIGIGINLKEVIVGNVGSERLSNFTAIGDGVNVASRICSSAKGGEIVVSESVYNAVKENYSSEFIKRSGVRFKGLEQDIITYEISYSKEDETPETIDCPKCKNILPLEAKFCGSCGFKF